MTTLDLVDLAVQRRSLRVRLGGQGRSAMAARPGLSAAGGSSAWPDRFGRFVALLEEDLAAGRAGRCASPRAGHREAAWRILAERREEPAGRLGGTAGPAQPAELATDLPGMAREIASASPSRPIRQEVP
jgi:hypothetical protein